MSTPRPATSPHAPQRPPWARAGERGNVFLLRLMAGIALHLGRAVARLVLHPITLYFMCFAPGARRHSRRYLERALGRTPRWRDGYRHVHAFASTVLDRVYFVRGQTQRFDLQISGSACLAQAGPAAAGAHAGAILLGAHLGSFEALHAVSRAPPAGAAATQVVMAMYPDNARMIHGLLQALAPALELPIIALGRSGSTLAMREALDAGALLALLADRSLGATRGGHVQIPFLGVPAPFSSGPVRLAMLLRRRVVFMAALYHGANRYTLHFEPLADFSAPALDHASPAARERLVHEALQRYVACLERLCHEAPYNWFNFFDFWREDTPH
jgi:predicted LPLAT superfamily acyltransferase